MIELNGFYKYKKKSIVLNIIDKNTKKEYRIK